jgi:hypothetical protein
MFDGIIRTLSDVCYILDMNRNLISLSTLDVKGFKYQGGDKLIKVSRGSLIVMKGDLNTSNCLYFLRGTTLSGNANVAYSKVYDSDATNLWHLRLGHMSKTGMLELCKRGLLDGQRIDKLEFCEHCLWQANKSEVWHCYSQHKRYIRVYSLRFVGESPAFLHLEVLVTC